MFSWNSFSSFWILKDYSSTGILQYTVKQQTIAYKLFHFGFVLFSFLSPADNNGQKQQSITILCTIIQILWCVIVNNIHVYSTVQHTNDLQLTICDQTPAATLTLLQN